MITVKMTKPEFEAYTLYLKSIEIMRNTGSKRHSSLTDEYLSDQENIREIEKGLEDIKAGRVTFIDPRKIWECIK